MAMDERGMGVAALTNIYTYFFALPQTHIHLTPKHFIFIFSSPRPSISPRRASSRRPVV
jgi:hypothetical protein